MNHSMILELNTVYSVYNHIIVCFFQCTKKTSLTLQPAMKKTKFSPFSRYQVMLQQAVNNRLGTILIDLDDVEQSLGVEL